jgi:hypothetical protein
MLIPITLTDFTLLNKHATKVDDIPPDKESNNDTGEPKSNAERHIRATFTIHAPFLSFIQIKANTKAFERPIFTPGAIAIRLIDNKLSRYPTIKHIATSIE